jgi:predicted DNA-binding transcriptional regulator YafY
MCVILAVMRETSARLLRLLGLLQVRPDWSGPELAARLGITARTLRRDVLRLRELGYPVHSVPGVGGGYRLGAGTRLPPLLLDDDEALAVVVGLRGAANHTVAGLADASVRALAKLDQVLPPRLRERAAALRQATVALAGPEPVIDAALLTALAAACRQRERVRLAYTDHGGIASVRVVEPHRLVSAGYRWYLMAFDVGKQDWRSFRVDRITSAETAGGRFVPRDPPDAAAFVAASVTSAPYRYQARVVVHATPAELARLIPPTVGTVEPASGGRCLLSTGSDSLDALAVHLVALGAEFSVLEPPELIERLQVLADRIHRVASLSRAG